MQEAWSQIMLLYANPKQVRTIMACGWINVSAQSSPAQHEIRYFACMQLAKCVLPLFKIMLAKNNIHSLLSAESSMRE